MTTIGVLAERDERETRVSLVPSSAAELIKKYKATVLVETNAGVRSGFLDADYEKAGARIVDRKTVLHESSLVMAVNSSDVELDAGYQITLGLCEPYSNLAHLKKLNAQNKTVIALEMIPRTSRAQSMDVLSSQANLAGYVAVIKAAERLNKVMPLFMTAAGTIKPARVLVIGAGVAGLQALATAKRLGAQVFGYDVRKEVKEQIESLGAKFVAIELDEEGSAQGGYARALSDQSVRKQRSLLTDFAATCDIVITTAQVPGRPAPRLLDEGLFEAMKPGSVIVDLAAKSGGNIAGSVLHEWTSIAGVWLYGAESLARCVAKDASVTMSKNITTLYELIASGFNLQDDIIKSSTICHQGQWINQTIAQLIDKEQR